GAAHEAAVDDDLGAATADGVDDLAQRLDRRLAMVELAAAVVGHPDHFDAALERDLGVARGLDSLDHEGQRRALAHAVERLPAQPLLPDEARRAARVQRRQPATAQLALATAVIRRVDGDRDRVVARGADAVDQLLGPTRVPAHVELAGL